MKSNLPKRILDIIKDGVWLLQLFIPTTLPLGTVVLFFILNKIKTLSLLDCILLAIIFFILLAICIKTIWSRFSFKSYHYPRKQINQSYNYFYVSREFNYSLEANKQLRYVRSAIIQSTANKVEQIRDKYIWTGKTDKPLTVNRGKGISSITSGIRLGVWNFIDLKLKDPLRGKGSQSVPLQYSWGPIDNYKTSSPFFSASTEIPTKKITMKLTLGKEYENQEIFCEVYQSSNSDILIKRESYKLDCQGSFTWVVQDVKRFRCYLVRWNWEKGHSPIELDTPI